MIDRTRRSQVEHWTGTERLIVAAREAVEVMPADVRLTDASALLGAAFESVADYIDGQALPIDIVETRRYVRVEQLSAVPRIRPVSLAGRSLIKSFESLKDGDTKTPNLDPYNDRPDDPEKGTWTIGWGHAIWFGGRFLKGSKDKARAAMLYPNGITLAEAETLFDGDVLETCRDIGPLLPEGVTENQYAALVCFAFNVGAGALGTSTLLRKFKAGDIEGAAAQFVRWNKSGGKVLPGLTRRREAERNLFMYTGGIVGIS